MCKVWWPYGVQTIVFLRFGALTINIHSTNKFPMVSFGNHMKGCSLVGGGIWSVLQNNMHIQTIHSLGTGSVGCFPRSVLFELFEFSIAFTAVSVFQALILFEVFEFSIGFVDARAGDVCNAHAKCNYFIPATRGRDSTYSFSQNKHVGEAGQRQGRAGANKHAETLGSPETCPF